jgi:hypothetical protein
MPTISYIDNCNRLDNLIYNNNNIQYICGNPLLISLLIALIVIIIVNLNYNNCFSQFLYSILFIMPLILLENKIIKYHYIVKGRGDNNIFNGSSDIIGSGKDNIIEPRKFIVKKTGKKDDSNENNNENDKKLFEALIDV